MEYLWIPITVGAAIMQIMRTALQKDLKRHISDMAVVWVRYAYALPFALLYVLTFSFWGHSLPAFNGPFVAYVLAGSLAQLGATAMLVRLFSYRNFAVSIMLSRTDALLAAAFGFALFGDRFSPLGILAVGLGLGGLILTLIGKQRIAKGDMLGAFKYGSAWLGIGSGALFAITSLTIREAINQVPAAHPFFAAALVLLAMIVVQALVAFFYLLSYEYSQFAKVYRVNRRSLAVGITSLLGSIGWYSAFALTHPAYVKTLAQIELPMAIAIGALFFGEKITRVEFWGILFIAMAVITVAFV